MYEHLNVHVLMRDERRKEERSKQGQTNNNPGAKVRGLRVRRGILRHYFASSRGARGYVRRRNFARSRVKIISARQFKVAHERCVKAARPFMRDFTCIDG